MRTVLRYCGTIREFRAWLRKQKCQVVDLAEYREKRKPPLQRRRRKSCSVIPFILPNNSA